LNHGSWILVNQADCAKFWLIIRPTQIFLDFLLVSGHTDCNNMNPKVPQNPNQRAYIRPIFVISFLGISQIRIEPTPFFLTKVTPNNLNVLFWTNVNAFRTLNLKLKTWGKPKISFKSSFWIKAHVHSFVVSYFKKMPSPF